MFYKYICDYNYDFHAISSQKVRIPHALMQNYDNNRQLILMEVVFFFKNNMGFTFG